MNNKNNSGNKNKPSNDFWLSGFLEEAKESGERLENKLVSFKNEHIYSINNKKNYLKTNNKLNKKKNINNHTNNNNNK